MEDRRLNPPRHCSIRMQPKAVCQSGFLSQTLILPTVGFDLAIQTDELSICMKILLSMTDYAAVPQSYCVYYRYCIYLRLNQHLCVSLLATLHKDADRIFVKIL